MCTEVCCVRYCDPGEFILLSQLQMRKPRLRKVTRPAQENQTSKRWSPAQTLGLLPSDLVSLPRTTTLPHPGLPSDLCELHSPSLPRALSAAEALLSHSGSRNSCCPRAVVFKFFPEPQALERCLRDTGGVGPSHL